MSIPDIETAKKAAARLGLTIIREGDHDHIQAINPMPPVQFADAILVYCYKFNASITSWGRTKAHNIKVGGLPHSLHLLFLASDVVYDD